MHHHWASICLLLASTAFACRSTQGNETASSKSLSHPLFAISPLQCGEVTSTLKACLGTRGSDRKSFISLERQGNDTGREQLDVPVTNIESNDAWTWYKAEQVAGEWLGELGLRTIRLGLHQTATRAAFLVWDSSQRTWRLPAIAAGTDFALTALDDASPQNTFTIKGPKARRLRNLLGILGGTKSAKTINTAFLSCLRPVVVHPITYCALERNIEETAEEDNCNTKPSVECDKRWKLAGYVYEDLVSEAGASFTNKDGQVMVAKSIIKATNLTCSLRKEECTFTRLP